MMAVLTDQETGDSITFDVERTPIDLPAVLPATPVEDGLPPARTRYAGPTSIQITILLARVAGIGDEPTAILRWIDRAATRARRVVYTIDGDDYRDLKIGSRSIERDPQTTSLRLSIVLQQVASIDRGAGTSAFPEADAQARPGVEDVEDGGQQSGEDEPVDGLLASFVFGGGG